MFGNKCADCGISYPPPIYDFHHLDPTKKDFTVANIIWRNLDSLREELDKCVMLCANCHRLRHYEAKQRETEGKTLTEEST